MVLFDSASAHIQESLQRQLREKLTTIKYGS